MPVLLHKKYSPEGTCGASGNKVSFTIVGGTKWVLC